MYGCFVDLAINFNCGLFTAIVCINSSENVSTR